jgi:hypothetical protein
MRRQKTQINIIISKKGDSTMNANEIYRIIKGDFKNLSPNKLEKL